MPKAKQSADWNKGYKAAKKQALDKAKAIAARIEMDINIRSGLSPMLWNDREHREGIVDVWTNKIREVLEEL